MGEDEQLGMDLGVPVERTAWARWVDPDRRGGQLRKFLDRIGLPDLPEQAWEFESAEASRIGEVIAEVFPDIETATAPENADLADQLVCFVGECFVRYAGAQWYDQARYSQTREWTDDLEYVSLYEGIEPAVAFTAESGDSSSYTAGYLVSYTVMYGFGGFTGTATLILAKAMLDEVQNSDQS
ncbi:hypothetical protein [Nocardia jiangxiensis]|uniref:hypothetical protein n=1 Tax=Nocardia jiangxiensis TaxID=282685 RepID=UPI000300365A|nr:hypothetical protein [Nocardia jiangxiensis]